MCSSAGYLSALTIIRIFEEKHWLIPERIMASDIIFWNADKNDIECNL
jgi:hypothetical protein